MRPTNCGLLHVLAFRETFIVVCIHCTVLYAVVASIDARSRFSVFIHNTDTIKVVGTLNRATKCDRKSLAHVCRNVLHLNGF